MDKIKKTLEKIGLTEKEIKIYLTSLSIGQSPASILGQRNNITRSTSQYTCNSLVEKGLMSITPKGNTFLYAPEDPEKILSLVNKEYDLVEKKFNSARQIIGDLKTMMNPQAKLPKVKYFTGVDGIIDMFEDVLKEGKNVYGYLYVGDDMNKEVLYYIQRNYVQRRLKFGIKTFTILNDEKKYDFFKKNSENLRREYKFISTQKYPIDVCLQIYGNKIAYYSYRDGDLTGVIIENEYMCRTQLSSFQALWDSIKPEEN